MSTEKMLMDIIQSDVPTFCGLFQASAIILAPGVGVPGSISCVKEGQ